MSDRAQMQHYPFPLSNGQVGILMLPPPWSLSEVDAERLAEFVDALAGPPPHLSRQETA